MSEEKTENVNEGTEDLLEEWPFSNNFILAAILLLIAAAFTLAFRTEEKANQYAIWAYYALVAGVLLRFAEIILEERFDIELKPYTYRKLEPLTSRIRKRSSSLRKAFGERIGLVQDWIPRKGGQTEERPEIKLTFFTQENSRNRSRPEFRLLKMIKGCLQRLKSFLIALKSYEIVKEHFICEECGARFGSPEVLEDHRKEYHA